MNHYSGKGGNAYRTMNASGIHPPGMLTATAAVACAIIQETRNPYLPGIFNAIIIALMNCANTCTFK